MRIFTETPTPEAVEHVQKIIHEFGYENNPILDLLVELHSLTGRGRAEGFLFCTHIKTVVMFPDASAPVDYTATIDELPELLTLLELERPQTL